MASSEMSSSVEVSNTDNTPKALPAEGLEAASELILKTCTVIAAGTDKLSITIAGTNIMSIAMIAGTNIMSIAMIAGTDMLSIAMIAGTNLPVLEGMNIRAIRATILQQKLTQAHALSSVY
jgi:hypothetical protein